MKIPRLHLLVRNTGIADPLSIMYRVKLPQTKNNVANAAKQARLKQWTIKSPHGLPTQPEPLPQTLSH